MITYDVQDKHLLHSNANLRRSFDEAQVQLLLRTSWPRDFSAWCQRDVINRGEPRGTGNLPEESMFIMSAEHSWCCSSTVSPRGSRNHSERAD